VVAALPGAPCQAQDSAATTAIIDSTMVPRSDSVRPDSVHPDSIRPDSVRPGSVRADGVPPDSVAPDSVPPGSANVAPRDTVPVPPPAPVDSAIGTACAASAGSAPDLLLVTFRPTATAEERAAVAREVGGTLVGPSEHAAPGSWYLRAPGSAGDRSVADRVIVLSPVLEVENTRCPS